jgi:hypothetical protein
MSLERVPLDENTGIILIPPEPYSDESAKKMIDSKFEPYIFYSPAVYYLSDHFGMLADHQKIVEVEGGYLTRIKNVPFSRDKMYVVVPASIGDTLFILGYLREWKKENSIPFISLIAKSNHESLVDKYVGIDCINEIIISNDIVNVLECYSIIHDTWKLKNYFYAYNKKNVFNETKRSFAKRAVGMTMRETYRNLVLRLSEDKFDIIPFSVCSEPQKRIILSPYAQSESMPAMNFWEALAEYFTAKGYKLYTNVKDDTEKAIAGTAPISLPLMDMADFCNESTAVITLRSGLSDLLAMTNVPLFTLYANEGHYKSSRLRDIRDRENIYEYLISYSLTLNHIYDDIISKIR